MSEPRNAIDLWELFQTGASGGLIIGQSTPSDVIRIVGEPLLGDGPGNPPWNTWITEIDDFEFYFQGAPPKLRSLKLSQPGYAIGYNGGRQVAQAVTKVETDHATITFRDIGWDDLLVLPPALARLWKDVAEIETGDDKMIALTFKEGSGCELILTYALQPRQREGGLYDFDYHFYALHVRNWKVDAELSKTLPSSE